MKTTILVVLIFLCFISLSRAQIKIGNNPKNLDPSAILEIESTNKGLLIPRLTSAERTAISNPANGLMVYQTDGVAGVYTYNSNSWQALGTSGSNGANGVDGKTVLNGTSNPTSVIGANGDFFINTTSNTLFGPKAAGAWPTGVSLVGPNGANGSNGTNGVDGKTVLNGSSNPTAAIGANGDFFINTTSSTLFGPKASGAWSTGVSLVGPAGTNGTNGLAGSNGTNGVDGKSVLNGTSNPTAAIGSNGDFFINTSSNTLFGPKASGAWPTGVSLVGSAGTNGTNGQGVPTGGTANQVLAKVDGTNYNTQWVTPATNGWSLNGNAGTTNSNFIGTTDNMGLTFRTNNIAQWLLTPKGRFVPVVPSNIFIGGGNETTTALSNTVVGSGAMINLTTGGFNTAIGDAALFAITTGVNNTAIGSTALTSTTTGSANTGTGKNALQLNSTGDGNTGIGQNALQTNTTGSNNTALGFGAGVSANNLNNATALGNGALVDASNKVRIGNDNVTATDIAGQVKVNAQSTTNNFTLPATRGTANQVLSTNGAGETSWVTSSGGGSSDNLGNHTATQNLNMNNNAITNATNITATGTATLGGNTYPTTTGTNGQVLQTNGAGALSWGSASGGGSSLQLVVTKTVGQTTQIGSSSSFAADVVNFESTNVTGAALTGGNTWTGNNLFTVGAGGAGTYLIQVQLMGGTNLQPPIPMIDMNNTGNSGSCFYGTVYSSINLQSPYRYRGQLTSVVYMTAGESFQIRALSPSTFIGCDFTTNGSTKVTVVKLN